MNNINNNNYLFYFLFNILIYMPVLFEMFLVGSKEIRDETF